jgi:hypothetical protein
MTYENLFSLAIASLGAVAFGAISIASLLKWIRDLKFYKSNNWDFTMRRKSRIVVRPPGMVAGKEMSPIAAFFFAGPFSIVLFATISIVIFTFIVSDFAKGFANGSS